MPRFEEDLKVITIFGLLLLALSLLEPETEEKVPSPMTTEMDGKVGKK